MPMMGPNPASQHNHQSSNFQRSRSLGGYYAARELPPTPMDHHQLPGAPAGLPTQVPNYADIIREPYEKVKNLSITSVLL